MKFFLFYIWSFVISVIAPEIGILQENVLTGAKCNETLCKIIFDFLIDIFTLNFSNPSAFKELYLGYLLFSVLFLYSVFSDRIGYLESQINILHLGLSTSEMYDGLFKGQDDLGYPLPTL